MQNVILRVVAMTGLLVCANSALADRAPQPPAQTAAAPSAGDKMVCRNLAAQTGSRLGGRRECRTQKEWDDIQHQQQDETSKMQTRGLTSGVKGQ